MNVRYWLKWFDKNTEMIVGKIFLEDVHESEIIKLFNLPGERPPFDCYDVTEDHLAWLESKSIIIDLESYNFQVAASS